MTRLGDELADQALGLATSLWSELGVDGSVRHHAWQAVDLEPLLLYTAWIGSADRRLRSRVIEWSIANHRLASAIRMRNLSRQASPVARASLARIGATVRAHTNAPWPARGDPLTLLPSAAVDAPDMRRPSLVQLRLRALVGVSARAEILRLLLADGERAKPASVIAEGAAYGKGSVAQALDLLTQAGIVRMQPAGNRLVYSLSRSAELRSAIDGMPEAFPDWAPILRITESLAGYARSAPAAAPARVARSRRLLHAIDQDVRRLGIGGIVPTVSGPDSIAELEQWALSFVADHAGTTHVSPARRDVTYTVRHLVRGGWAGSRQGRGVPARPLEAASRSRDDSLDEESGPRELSLAIFSDVLGRESQQSGLALVKPELSTTSTSFAEEAVRPITRGAETSFTAEFVRRWFENRRP